MTQLENGEYLMDITLTGGSGRANIISPAKVIIDNEDIEATIEWNSKFYDYMEIDGVGYEPINSEGNSVFLVKVKDLDSDIPIKAETTAMSTPHMIDYTIRLNSASAKAQNGNIAPTIFIVTGIFIFLAAVGAAIFKTLRRKKSEN